MEKRRVVITGLGTVNPLGNSVPASWAAAKAGQCGIGPITQFDTTGFKCKLAGEVKNFDPETVVDKKEARKMARFTLLALAAASEALTDSGLDTKADAKSIGVILSSGIGGFTSMKALSTATDPDAASLPFDARRGGFVMGEGSGVLVLEALEHAKARGAHIYAEVVGYGANCDAYHFTAPAPGGAGAIDCVKLTLADAGIAPEQVDHINAHGTGTHMNDACETAAIHAVFGEHAKELTVVSTKSMTGHLLGGAGGIEAVFTALALRDQFAPPTIHYAQPDPECDLDYVPNTGRAQAMTYALSNSLGFGGHNACIALRRWEG